MNYARIGTLAAEVREWIGVQTDPSRRERWKVIDDDLEKALGPDFSDRAIKATPVEELASSFSNTVYETVLAYCVERRSAPQKK